LNDDASSDIVIIGGGIAGAATAYYLLKDTGSRVMLLEKGRVAHGATGHNAGQVVAASERPFLSLAEEYGAAMVAETHRQLRSAWSLLREMIDETETSSELIMVTAHLGLSTVEDALLLLKEKRIREELHAPMGEVHLSEELEGEVPEDLRPYCHFQPIDRLMELMEADDPRYLCVLEAEVGVMSTAQFTEDVLSYLEREYGDRFVVYEESPADSVSLRRGVTIACGSHTVTASQVVLCTNGYQEVEILDAASPSIDGRLESVVGFMVGFLEAEEKEPAARAYFRGKRGEADTRYLYLTRRKYIYEGKRTLTSVGGPDYSLKNERYDPEKIYLPDAHDRVERFYKQTTTAEPEGSRDFDWKGLMGYTEGGVRMVGRDPRNPALFYNLGCNGIGVLQSVHGGKRVAKIISGEEISPSIFDPR